MNDNENNEANEPQAEYNIEKKITVFKSFEEMNEADAKEMAFIPPLENLKNATTYIQHLYAEELKQKMDLTIYIKKDEHTDS